MLSHRLDQVDRSGHIVRVVQHRLCDRLAHGLAPGKVNHGIKLLGAQSSVDRSGIAEVAFHEGHLCGLFGSGELLHALETLEERVVEVVEDGDGEARVEQREHGVRAFGFLVEVEVEKRERGVSVARV